MTKKDEACGVVSFHSACPGGPKLDYLAFPTEVGLSVSSAWCVRLGWGGPNLDLLAFPTEVGILFVSRFQVSVGQARV